MAVSASTNETLNAGPMTGAMRATHGGTSIKSSDIANAVLKKSDGAAWTNLQNAACTYALRTVF